MPPPVPAPADGAGPPWFAAFVHAASRAVPLVATSATPAVRLMNSRREISDDLLLDVLTFVLLPASRAAIVDHATELWLGCERRQGV